eukprot:761823-Hanusia_phi.AAC.1
MGPGGSKGSILPSESDPDTPIGEGILCVCEGVGIQTTEIISRNPICGLVLKFLGPHPSQTTWYPPNERGCDDAVHTEKSISHAHTHMMRQYIIMEYTRQTSRSCDPAA